MIKTDNIMNFPTWALPNVVNDDPSGLTDEDVASVNYFVHCLLDNLNAQWLEIVPIEGAEPFFSQCPAFGKACEVETVCVIYEPKSEKEDGNDRSTLG